MAGSLSKGGEVPCSEGLRTLQEPTLPSKPPGYPRFSKYQEALGLVGSGPLLLGVHFLIPDPVWESKGMSHGCWV